MTNLNTKPPHPASYVKEIIKGKKLTTVKAAKLLGIGRIALTNFLNKKAELSPEMAARLEKVFSIDKPHLLQMQLERYSYEVNHVKKELLLDSYEEPIQYSDSYPLKIIAKKIENWSDYLEARNLLPVLIRRLINTTGKELTKVDFPGHENSQLPGWDGEVIAGSATQKIPLGESRWELGTGGDPRKKANDDYKSRTENKKIPLEERQKLTFVFVTSRQWSGKKIWAENKRSKKEWRDVRAYDADDLEQWLELSPETHIWFLEKTNDDNSGLCSLEQCWEDWASATNPNLNKTLFKEAVETHRKDFLLWLQNNPPAKPFIITSDSHEEALAFLACMFDHIDKIYSDKTIAVKSPEALRKLKTTSSKGIIVISSSEAEKNLGNYRNSVHTIIIRYKNEIKNTEEASIILDLSSHNSFENSLTEMGMDYDQRDRYIKNSSYSPTILRRLLCDLPVDQYPEWYKDENIIHKLIPITLIGFWDNNSQADKDAIRMLFDVEKDRIVENAIESLWNMDTTLLWVIDNKIGVKSKLGSLSLVKEYITKSYLNNFFTIAQDVLGEKDPALELPAEDRIYAAWYGKIRKHSEYIRKGVCETLVLLAINGNNWFQLRFGIDIQGEVNKVIRKLLQPFNQNTLLSQNAYISLYAEAAPEEFLKIVEEDLSNSSSTILSLCKSERDGIFYRNPIINFLFALEILAWDPQNLLRVVKILGKLSQHKIDDNYSNAPINSLKNIFKSWMPQTSANLEIRKKILLELIKHFPSIGWKICIDQFEQNFCTQSSRPRWRNDASGSGYGVNEEEHFEFVKEAKNRVLEWNKYNKYDENSLGELLERLQAFNDEDKARIWQLIIDWNLTNQSDEQKSRLRERIRYYALPKEENVYLGGDNRKANDIYNLLEPKDLIWKHHWLFASPAVQSSISEITDENYCYEQRDKQIEQSRIEALSEIWQEANHLGIIQLISISNACCYIGFNLRNIITQSDIIPLFDNLLSSSSEEIEWKIDKFIECFLRQSTETTETNVIEVLINHYIELEKEEECIRILKNAPLRNETWRIVSNLNQELQQRYWSKTNIINYNLKETELKELIEKLMWVNRPEYAISMIRSPRICKNVDSEQLVILLRKMTSYNQELWQQHNIDHYVIESIFNELSIRTDISEDDIMELEFFYIEILEQTSYGIPCLEKNITKSPQFFIQALAIAYKREDGNDDSEKWIGKNLKNFESIASMLHSLLNKVQFVPGTVNGIIDKNSLLNWVQEVRKLCIENNREKIGDQYIGLFLSKAPIGADVVWPCEPVRCVLEHIKSKQMAAGLSNGVYNARGSVIREKGGEQERELVAKYKSYAQNLEYDYPYVSQILNEIAAKWESEARHWDNEAVLQNYV